MNQTLSESPHVLCHPGPGSQAAMEPALRVMGCVPREQALALDDLRCLAVRELGPTEIVCMSGRYIEQVGGYRGVSLLDVLELTGLADVPRPTLKECVIVARGGDGYRALFSWTELYNTSTGDGVLVVYEKNFQRLDERSGPLGLVSASDRHLGPRHLRRLCEIQVLRLPP